MFDCERIDLKIRMANSYRRHSGQAQREPESSPLCRQRLALDRRDSLDSRPGLLSAGVTFFRGNDGSFWV